MTIVKNDAFIFLLDWLDFWWEGIRIWCRGGRGGANFWLVGLGYSPHPPSSENPVYKRTLPTGFYIQWSFYVHHIHHVPKWPFYFCKIWALCVSQIYMVYISLACSVFVIKFITSWTCLITSNDGRSISQKSISH